MAAPPPTFDLEQPFPPLVDIPDLLLPIASHDTFTNWATTFSSHPDITYTPTSLDQLRLILHYATASKLTLRIRGSGHSPSDLVCTDGILVNLTKLSAFISTSQSQVDPDFTVVHVQGGIKLSAINSLLASLSPQPLSLSSLGSISDQTIAGALQTATHGSGVTFGNLSSYVEFLDLLLPLPGIPVVRCSATQDPELFKAALCGLGAIGVVVGVGMRAEKRFKLEEELWAMEYDEFAAKWEAVAGSGEHVRAFYFPQVDEVKVSRLNRTTLPITAPENAVSAFITDTVFGKHLHYLGLLVAKVFPSFLPFHGKVIYSLVHRPAPSFLSVFFFGNAAEKRHKAGVLGQEKTKATDPTDGGKWKVKSSTPDNVVDWSERIFNYDCGPPQYTYEFAIPLSSVTPALALLKKWAQEKLWESVHFPIELRWTKGDDIFLSPTQGSDGLYIGLVQYRPYNIPVPYKELFASLEALLLPLGARPHWAKSHSATVQVLHKLYPKLGDWLAVRERVDPGKVLVNPYLSRHLGLE